MKLEGQKLIRKDNLMRVNFRHGNFTKTTNYLKRVNKALQDANFEKYGERGVNALRDATPKDTGKTSESWSYSIYKSKDFVTIKWSNSNVNQGVNIAVILQYGHGTKSGGYVRGIDYINPAMKPIFEQLAKEAWEEVKL